MARNRQIRGWRRTAHGSEPIHDEPPEVDHVPLINARNDLVCVTRRIETPPDHRGARRLIVAEGEVMPVDEARRRGLTNDDYEAYDPQAAAERQAQGQPSRSGVPMVPRGRGGLSRI